MIDFIVKNTVAFVAIIIAGIALFSGGNGDVLGTDSTTFTNPLVIEETSGTSSLTIQSNGVGGCLIIEQSDGSGYGYFTANGTGSLATTTSAGC